MRKPILLSSIFIFLSFPLFSQQNPEWNSAKIKLQLEKLNTLGRVLYVGAHPDDENSRLLAWLVNQKKFRTAYLSLTRGDGGQNLVGNEQGPYLGLMRTEELLAARHNDGAEQFFSHALDFGYSKTAKETFSFWGHQRILADVVWRVRKFRPDIIICRFPEDKRAGHGNHWASAVLAHEAFIDAADSTKFPEQLKYVKTWQAKRILWNTYHFGSLNTTSPSQFHINISDYNPFLGKDYAEMGAASRSMNKTQGFGVSPRYGKDVEYFKTIAGSKPEKTLMDGVNTTWSKLKNGAAIQTLIEKALKEYDVDNPSKIVPILLKIRTKIKDLDNEYWRNYKLKKVNELILACSGILLNAYSSQPYIVVGKSLKIHTMALNRSNVSVKLNGINILGQKENVGKDLSTEAPQSKDYTVSVPKNKPISQPYWMVEKHAAGYYKFSNQQLVGLPENPPELTAVFSLTINGQSILISRQIMYDYTDPVRGKVLAPLVVTPPVTANIEHGVYVFTAQKAQQIKVVIKSYKDGVSGVAHIDVPANFTVKNNDQKFSLKKKDDEVELTFIVLPSGVIKSSSSGNLTVHLKVDGKDYQRGIKVIAPHYIPTITVFPPSQSKLVAIQLKTTGHNIGYIMGAGDKVPQALEQMGYKVKLLSDNDLENINLSQFDAIVTGVRAYNTRKELKYAEKRLLNYVKAGGTLVVQYNKNFNLVTKQLGPYPFEVTNNRTTDETAHVSFLLPNDSVLNYPNKITEQDFSGWIQERGVYYLNKIDSHYKVPLAMHDPNEPMLDGSLVVCGYGKGKYVYSGLDFFRELPAGVPGAFRLFANLIASKKK